VPNETHAEQVAVPLASEDGRLIPVSHALSGPLPSSREFAGYERVLSGSAERILAIWEREVANRHEGEKTMIKESIRLSSRGQFFGLVTILVCAGLILASTLLNQPLAAIPSAIVALAGIATVFFGKK